MNATQHRKLFLAATFFLLCRSATAAPPAPYRLTLSLVGDTNGGSLTKPQVTFNLRNSTPRTLLFTWAPRIEPIMQFQVDYKGPAENPSLNTGWLPLKPDAKPAPSAPDHGVITECAMRIKDLVLPGQAARFSTMPDFPMSTPGFYRVTLTMTLPHINERGEPVGTSIKPHTLL